MKLRDLYKGLLGSKTRIGVIWSGVERFSTQIVQFIISIVLARLLSPSDYGLIAIVNIFLVLFTTINETGFGAALMQKLDRDERDFSSVFIFNIVLGILLYAILFFCAPLIARFFNNEQLINLTRIVGINLIISSFIVVQKTQFIIKIDFKSQAKASVSAALVSGIVGIYYAYKGMGVMSLVFQSVINTSLNAVLIWSFSSWRPKLLFSFKRFKGLFLFAYKLTLARLINVVYNEVAPILIGKFLSPADLGFYNRAYSFQSLPSGNIVGIVQRVSTPLLCEQQNDLNQMKDVLRRFIVKTSSWVFPIMMIMMVLARPMVLVLLTEKWEPCVLMLQLMCPIGIFYVLNSFNLNIFNAMNRTDLALKLEVIKKIICVILIVIALRYGIYVLIASQIIVSIIELIFNTYYTKKLLGFGLLEQIRSLKSVLIVSLISCGFAYLCTVLFSNSLAQLIVGGIVGVSCYLLFSELFNVKLM